jgi:hypothetical protein
LAYFDRKDDYGYIRWAQDVKRRDHFVCYICGLKGVQLNSHHMNSWADHPSERYDVLNGICLCSACHDRYHEIYGKGKNTKEQFKEFEKIMSVIIKNANEDGLISSTAKRMIQHAELDMAIDEIIRDLDGYRK